MTCQTCWSCCDTLMEDEGCWFTSLLKQVAGDWIMRFCSSSETNAELRGLRKRWRKGEVASKEEYEITKDEASNRGHFGIDQWKQQIIECSWGDRSQPDVQMINCMYNEWKYRFIFWFFLYIVIKSEHSGIIISKFKSIIYLQVNRQYSLTSIIARLCQGTPYLPLDHISPKITCQRNAVFSTLKQTGAHWRTKSCMRVIFNGTPILIDKT